jgi:hypothetical protein
MQIHLIIVTNENGIKKTDNYHVITLKNRQQHKKISRVSLSQITILLEMTFQCRKFVTKNLSNKNVL